MPAGYGKVEVLEGIERRLQITPDRTVYVGDGSSDVHVMLHVNNRDGFTIAVSENQLLSRIAQRTVLSDSALSVLVPILRRMWVALGGDPRACSNPTGFRFANGRGSARTG